MPSYLNNSSGLYKHRAKSIPNLPSSAADIHLEEKHKVTIGPDPKKFLIYDNERSRRLMLFCSLLGLLILSLCEKWHADGTFHTASKYFGQLYIIHGWYKHRMIPCAWILMKKRKTIDYKKVFGKIAGCWSFSP